MSERLDWDDRAVDAALHEVHGSRPPDLSARVLLALRETTPGPLPRLQPRAGGWWRAWLVAALLLVALAVGYRLADPAVPALATVAEVDVLILDGDLTVVAVPLATVPGPQPGPLPAARVVRHGAAGERLVFAAQPGDRLQTRHGMQAHLGAFGVLAGGPATELEVRTMEFTRKQGVTTASVLTLTVVAGVATWIGFGRTETAAAGEVVRLEASDQVAKLTAENSELRDRLKALEQQNAELAAAHARTPAPVAPAPAETAAAAAPAAAPAEVPAAMAVLFDDPRFHEALATVDWKLVGDVSKEMQPLLVELAKVMAEPDAEMPMELVIKIQELNGKLVAQLPGILKAGLPGFGPNGAYTHPLFAANSLASTLRSAGLGLDANQEAALAGLVRSFGAENQSIAEQTHGSDIEHLLAEIEMKERFYAEVAGKLTPQQAAAIWPEGSKEYDGINLFGTSLMTRTYSEPISAKDPADFARLASSRIGEDLGLDEATTTQVRSIVETMSRQAPELWEKSADGVENKLRMLRSGRAVAAMKQQVAIMREIQRQVRLTPEQQNKLLASKRVLVPLPK